LAITLEQFDFFFLGLIGGVEVLSVNAHFVDAVV
jgi:hypothetical protein